MKRIYCLVLAYSFAVTACVNRSKKAEAIRQDDRAKIQSELSHEMSLKADREELKELRKDIPEETQKSNDELALFLNLMKQGTENPSIVRDRFMSMVAKRRQSFRQKVERLRSDYRAAETRRREDFTRDQQKKREAYLRGKHDYKEMSRFSADLERERIRFFGDERDRRSNFESELNAQSKDFESYMREKTNEFNEQLRLYSKKLSEKPKEKKAVIGDEFKRLDEMPAKTIGTED